MYGHGFHLITQQLRRQLSLPPALAVSTSRIFTLALLISMIFLIVPAVQADLPVVPTQIVRIEAPTPQERSALVSMGIDVLDADLEGLLARVTPEQKGLILEAGFTIFELPELEAHYVVDPAYHRYGEVVHRLSVAGDSFPEITRLVTLGQSIEGRPIPAIVIGRPAAGGESMPGVLFFSRIHAREHLTTEMALYLIDLLLGEYGRDAAITNLVNQREIWIVPDANPDGSEYDLGSGIYQWWRKNRRPNDDGSFGVDLNRNFGYLWGCCGGSSPFPFDPVYRGTGPFSEPETAIIRDLILNNPHITASISFHTYSELILWPFGYTYEQLPEGMDPLDYTAFETIGTQMARLNGYRPMQSSGLYLSDGSSDDWLYGEMGVFAFTFEMYPISNPPGFYPPGDVIERETARNREALEYFLGIADNPRKVAGLGGDISPPAITVTLPAENALIAGPIAIHFDARDDIGVTLVEVLIDDQTAGLLEDPGEVFIWDGNPSAGQITIQARAFDAGHNVGWSEPIGVYRGVKALPIPLLVTP